VQKLIAGPGVFICDECVDLCTGIVDDDTELFRLMKGNDETGGQADPALFELARGTSTKELAHYAERGRKGVERNRLLRVAIYAKGASIYQRSDARDPTSTDDEIAKCIRCCRDKGWEVVETYTDAGTKGTPHRELEQMLEDAAAGKFDIVVATAMNRFSRNLSDIVEATAMNRFSRNLSDMFSLFKRLWAEDVCVFTLAEDFVTPLPSAVLNRMRDEDR
jgi:Fe-S-cluster containining protein